jgi:hypothetical protein
MDLKTLSALESRAKRALWRVSFVGPEGPDTCPTLGQPGLSLERACAVADRLEALAHVYGFKNIAVVDEALKPVFAPHEPYTPPPPPPAPTQSRLHRLAAAEGIDLDLLVNPDALEPLMGADPITIKAL